MPPDNAPILTDDQARRISRRKSLISFSGLTVSAVAAYSGWRWLMTRPEEQGLPWPLRRVLGMNRAIGEKLFHDGGKMDELPAGRASGPPRLNTYVGVDTAMDEASYRLDLLGVTGGPVSLTLNDLKKLPRTRQTTRLCCVEGWSTWANWTGVRVADLVALHPPVGQPPYVSMSTPGNGYYVGLDYASAVHPQSLLVYELDGRPLSPEHGYPVRLVIPTKYGIKNIKQVTRLEFTHTRPADYWTERGYDWYSGL